MSLLSVMSIVLQAPEFCVVPEFETPFNYAKVYTLHETPAWIRIVIK